MTKGNKNFFVLFIFSFCLQALIEYGVIATAVHPSDPLENFTTLRESFVQALPGVFLGLVLIGTWSWYCYRTFPNTIPTTKVPGNTNIDIRLEAALLDRYRASRGTYADRMWLAGIVWGLAGGGLYMFLMANDLSPVRALIKIFN